MNPNTVFHFACLTYRQKMQPITADDLLTMDEQPELLLRLAGAFLRGLWNALSTLAHHMKKQPSQSAPNLEHTVNQT